MFRIYSLCIICILIGKLTFCQALLEKEFGNYAPYGENTTFNTSSTYQVWNFGLSQEKDLISISPIDEDEAQGVAIIPGAFQNTYGGGATDLYLEKRSQNGTIIWNTFLGGEDGEGGTVLVTASAIYVFGITRSHNNIATPNTFMDEFLEAPIDRVNNFIVKFDLNGQKIWGTYYRTSPLDEYETISDIIVDENTHSLYITGLTQSGQGVATVGSFDNSIEDASYKGFIAKFDDTGNRIWGSYYGTSGPFDFTSLNNITVDSFGNIVIGGYSLTSNAPSLDYFIDGGAYNDGNNVGYETFLAKFNPIGERMWGLIYGGLDIENTFDLKVDSQNNIIWQGSTRSLTEISTPGSHQPELGSTNPVNGTGDSFLAKFDPNGQIVWATYYGGQLNDSFDNVNSTVLGFNTNSIALDENDNIYFTSITKSENNIATLGTYQDLHNDPNSNDGFVTKFTPSGERIWGTYFGGEDNDYPYGVLYAGNDEFYIYGTTESTSGIATPNGFWQNEFPTNSDEAGFVMKFRPTTLGLGENTISKLTLSPNPAKSYFQVNSKSNEKFSITIVDVQGRTIKHLKSVQPRETIKTEAMGQGLYFVNIKAENRNQTLKLLVE